MGFIYSFIETLINSLWQSALLAIMYACLVRVACNMHPIQKRNIAYLLLAFQFLLSIVTFSFYYFEKVSFSFLQIPSFNWLVQYSNLLFYTYSCYIVFRITTLIAQWYLFKKQYKSELIKPSADVNIFVKSKSYQLGIKRKVQVWFSKQIQVPITFGFLKPIILLPLSLLNNITAEETESIILHELAHIKSKDYLLNWLLMVIETIYFFNPFIKIIAANIKIEREKNCDIQVINFNYNEILYAQILLKIASTRHTVNNFQLGAVLESSQLLKRILFFSESKDISFKKYSINFIAIGIFLFFFSSVLFILPQHKKGLLKPNTAFVVKKNNSIQNTLSIPSLEINNKSTIISNEEIIENKSAKKEEIIFAFEKNIAGNIKPKENISNSNDLFKQVSFNEMLIDSIKEVLYNIETSQGKMTKSFKLYKQNGVWIMEPQWTIMETSEDSTLNEKVIFMPKDSVQ